jgi:hypothetical protein
MNLIGIALVRGAEFHIRDLVGYPCRWTMRFNDNDFAKRQECKNMRIIG